MTLFAGVDAYIVIFKVIFIEREGKICKKRWH